MSKGCHNCYGKDMDIDAVDNPCWNCKAGNSEWKAKPMTNADRIRAMSDEELIKFFELEVNACPPDTDEDKWCDTDDDCKRCWLEWLKQPVKEDD